MSVEAEAIKFMHATGVWVYNHIAVVWLGVCGMAAALFWAAKQYFATTQAVHAFTEDNTEQHEKIAKELGEKIDAVRKEMNDNFLKLLLHIDGD